MFDLTSIITVYTIKADNKLCVWVYSIYINYMNNTIFK